MHTQCPKCRTIFNVTEQILAVKAGLVRCGDCENVFNATWNLVDEEPHTGPSAPTPSRIVSVRPRRRDERVEDDFPLPPRDTFSDDSEPAAAIDTDDGGQDESFPDDTDDDIIDIDAAGPIDPHEETRDFDVEPQGDDDDAVQRHRRAFGPLVRHPADHDDDSSPVSFGPHADETDAGEDEDLSDEEIRRTLRLDNAFDEHEDDVDEDENDSESNRPMTNREDHRTARGDEHDGATDSGRTDGRIEPRLDASPRPGLSVGADDGLLPRQRPSRAATPRAPLRRKPAIQLKAPSHSPRAAPADDPGPRVDPNVHWVSIPDNDRRGTQFLWASGVLVLIVLVVLQVRFFLVDELYSIEGTRPYISLFCEFAGCAAPQRVEPGAIDIAQTRVDLHPEVPGAIRINVNLINRAGFAQPYPALELTLSDKDGRIVGRRTYEPSDYLRERPETALLDPGILAIASINLVRPNENAVGFETRVVASGGH